MKNWCGNCLNKDFQSSIFSLLVTRLVCPSAQGAIVHKPRRRAVTVRGTDTEQVRTCGFRRKSSSSDKAPKKRDSVRLNSFESFLVTLPSISSETWEMYSWAISGSSVFCDWPFFVFSGVSLETAANFLLVLKVAMILGENFCHLWRLNWFFQ